MGLICQGCGKEFKPEEHETELCNDDYCRDCHTSNFTFEDCFMYHRYLMTSTIYGNKYRKMQTVTTCPRCKKFYNMEMEIKGNKLTVKCTNCDFNATYQPPQP